MKEWKIKLMILLLCMITVWKIVESASELQNRMEANDRNQINQIEETEGSE